MGREYFIGSLPAKTFPWSIVQFVLDAFELARCHEGEVRPFGEVLTDEADHIFYCSFLPRAVGIAEVRLEFQESFYLPVLRSFRPAIEGEGTPQSFWK